MIAAAPCISGSAGGPRVTLARSDALTLVETLYRAVAPEDYTERPPV